MSAIRRPLCWLFGHAWVFIQFSVTSPTFNDDILGIRPCERCGLERPR